MPSQAVQFWGPPLGIRVSRFRRPTPAVLDQSWAPLAFSLMAKQKSPTPRLDPLGLAARLPQRAANIPPRTERPPVKPGSAASGIEATSLTIKNFADGL
jgi:hypothetical protein